MPTIWRHAPEGRQNGGMTDGGQRTQQWLRPGSLALVFVGGCLGAAAREALGAVLPQGAAFPVAVLIANLLGAALLGMLLEGLARTASVASARVRLLCGTGMLGGFTTYSSLALAIAALLHGGQGWVALGYGLGTLLLGALATFAGIALAAAMRRRGAAGQASAAGTGGGGQSGGPRA